MTEQIAIGPHPRDIDVAKDYVANAENALIEALAVCKSIGDSGFDPSNTEVAQLLHMGRLVYVLVSMARKSNETALKYLGEK